MASHRIARTDPRGEVVAAGCGRRGRGRLTLATLAVALVAVALVAVAAGAQGPAAGAQQGGLSDVAGGVHKPAIDALAQRGVFEGTLCGQDMFCPSEPIERSVVAVWLIRALDQQPAAAGATRFSDIDADDWQAPYIERLAELEITLGCQQQPLLYCPTRPVTRAQMASFLVRALDLAPAEPAGFADTADSTHQDSIDRLAAANITAGCQQQPLLYCPTRPVTRAQMATFLARALGLVETPDPDPPARTYKQVTTGAGHSCALASDDTITCWGYNPDGRADAPAGTYKQVTAGSDHSCALASDDTITCWGSNWQGQSDAPAGTYKQVTAGSLHSCALASDDTITCWGSNHYGQTDAPAGTYKQVTAGSAHSCALASDDTITCWPSLPDGVRWAR